jgi:tetratricopeptide (TPR) repeat protein
MKQIRNTLALSLILIIAISSLGLAQSDPSELLQSGIYKEEVEGELEGAIEIYEKIIAEHSQNRSVAAQAQLHIGLCYEKLGKAEAIKAYELVVEEYYGQKEQVTAALGRLAELRKEPPEGLSVVNLGGWDKPGMAFQPIEISPDGAMGVGVEFIKGQNIIVYNLNTKQVKYITNHTWDAPKGSGFIA